MAEKERGQRKDTGIMYSKEEAAKLFGCLSLEAQDELLSVMREMVKLNKATLGTAQAAG